MKTELNKVVQASASAMSNYNRLDAEYQKYVRQSDEWKNRAGQALDAGNEDLARKALAKKGESDKQVASMQASVEMAKTASEKLKSQVLELKRKIEEGERTATTLVARKNAASAQRKVAEAMSGSRQCGQRLFAVEPFRRERLQGRGHRQSLRPARLRRQRRRPGSPVRPTRRPQRRGRARRP